MDEDGFPTKFLIDGIDRLGKSSLIERIQEELGYHLVIHYDKPKALANFMVDAENMIGGTHVSDKAVTNQALKMYQEEANRGMFELLKSNVPIIFDRTHLGELVYAPLYRGYDGSYVFEMEKDLIESKFFTQASDIRLILLTSSNTDMLKDDGKSFDPTKKKFEQDLFIEAFHKSKLTNKVIVDVHDGAGGYKSFDQVFQAALYKPVSK